ncbi:hypothetical protein HBN63_21430 [Pseudomonas sp. WS 5011]|nr:hypothetical protein [Pseudomonas sp. WS 5011]
MRRFNYRWVLLLLVFHSITSYSSTLTYWDRVSIAGQDKYTSATQACNTFWSNGAGLAAGQSFDHVQNSSTEWVCRAKNPFHFFDYARSYSVGCPYGDNGSVCNTSCDSPKTMINGQCVAPAPDPCVSKSGSPQEFTKSGSSGDGYGTISGGYVAGVQSACFGGCAVNTSDQKCTGTVSGLYTCRGTAYHSGQSCSTTGTGTEIQDNAAQEPRPDPQVITEDKPCVYSGTGDTQTCVSSKGEEKEGQYCGTVNGVKTCVDSKPTKNGIEIQTTFKTETQPDGSKTTTKTDTATKTTCSGAGQCSSTSTTTTTTTKTDSNGKTTSVTGSCTGEACPDKNGNPDGDGDGFGDCIGDDCGDGEGGGANDWYEPGEDTYASVIGEFADAVSDIPVVAGVDNFLTFTPSGACPVYTVQVSIFGSPITLRLDQWCTGSTIPWELIKAVILACCAFFAFRIAFM